MHIITKYCWICYSIVHARCFNINNLPYFKYLVCLFNLRERWYYCNIIYSRERQGREKSRQIWQLRRYQQLWQKVFFFILHNCIYRQLCIFHPYANQTYSYNIFNTSNFKSYWICYTLTIHHLPCFIVTEIIYFRLIYPPYTTHLLVLQYFFIYAVNCTTLHSLLA